MKKKYLTISNLYNRFTAEVPTFFKKLRKFLLFCATLGGLLAGARVMYPEQLSFISIHVDGYLMVLGLIGAAVASLTVNNPNENPKVD